MTRNGQPEALLIKRSDTPSEEYSVIETLLTDVGFSVGTTTADLQLDLSDAAFNNQDLLVIISGSNTVSDSFINAEDCIVPIIGTGAHPELWLDSLNSNQSSFRIAKSSVSETKLQYSKLVSRENGVSDKFPNIIETGIARDADGGTYIQGSSLGELSKAVKVIANSLTDSNLLMLIERNKTLLG